MGNSNIKYIIAVGMIYNNGQDEMKVGYIGSIKYTFIEKSLRGEVDYRSKDGDVDTEKMFSLVSKSKARIYDSENKLNSDMKLLIDNFTGLRFSFYKVPIDEGTARQFRQNRKVKEQPSRIPSTFRTR